MTTTIRAGLLALVLAGFSVLSATPALACDHGYFRFVGSWGAGPWNAREADYSGTGPHGLSVFMDLTEDQITTMMTAKGSAIKVGKIACDDLRAPLTYTAAPTNATDWTQAGRDNHGVLSTATATSRDDFNDTQVHNQRTDTNQAAPTYLSGCQLQAANRTGGGNNNTNEDIINGDARNCAAND